MFLETAAPFFTFSMPFFLNLFMV